MKHLLVSIIVALVVAPALAARDRIPQRGVRRMVVFLLVFHLLYVAYLTLWYAPYVVPPVSAGAATRCTQTARSAFTHAARTTIRARSR